MKSIFKTSLIAVVLLIGITASAQEKPLTFGVKAGVNLSNMGGDASGTDAKIGFQGGVTLDYAITPELYIISGLNVSTKGFKMKDVEMDFSDWGKGDYSGDVTFNPIYLELPIHLGYKLRVADNTKLVFQAGPYLAYGVGGKATIKKNIGGEEKGNVFSTGGLKEFDFGFGGAVGAEFGKIGVNLGYDFGFVNVADTDEGKFKNMNAYLTVGYKF